MALRLKNKAFFRVCSAVLVVMTSGLIASGSLHAQQDNLNLQDVLREAYLNNPTLRAARAELRAVHELLPQAYAGMKPTIEAEGSLTTTDIEGSNFGGADGATSKDVAISIEQPLYRGGRTFAAIDAARNRISAQNAILKASEQAILLDAATVYMDVVRDRALVDLNQNNKKVIARQLEATRERFNVGELTRTDVSQAEARLEEAVSGLIQAQGDLEASQARFEQVVGYEPSPVLEKPVYALSVPETLEEALDIAVRENPDVVAAMFVQKAAEDDVDQIFGELLPSLAASASWNRTLDPQPGAIEKQTTKSAALTARVPLYQAGSVRSRVREAKETANQNYLEILEVKRLARQQTISNWESLRAARSEIRSREAQVRAAGVAQEGVRRETEVGARTILDALDADQEYLDAQASLVTAQRNEVVADFALAATLGVLTPENLGFSNDKIEMGSHLDDVKRRIFSTGVPSDVDSVAGKQ